MENEVFGEFMNALVNQVSNALVLKINAGTKMNEQTSNTSERMKIWGIRGIGKYLGVSIVTAQHLKDSGRFPVQWVGGKCFVYSDDMEKGLQDGRKY